MLSTSTTSANPVVLIVEDDVSVRHVLHSMLTHLGSRTSTAVDADSAVAATLDQPDLTLALIDLSLDGCDGTATAHELLTLRPDLLIVLMSGDPDHLLEAQQLVDVFHVLSKPFSLKELAELVAAARCHTPRLKERHV